MLGFIVQVQVLPRRLGTKGGAGDTHMGQLVQYDRYNDKEPVLRQVIKEGGGVRQYRQVMKYQVGTRKQRQVIKERVWVIQ